MVKYSLAWAEQYRSNNSYNYLRKLIIQRRELIEPKCGCGVKRFVNKIVNKGTIADIERLIDDIIKEQ